MKLFCFFTICTMVWIFIAVKNRYLNLSTALKSATMNSHSCEKQIFGCAKIRNDSKETKASRNEAMQLTNSNNDSRSIVPYHVHNQAGLDNLSVWALRKWVSLFKCLQEFKVAYQQGQLERPIFDYIPIMVGRWKLCLKTLNLDVLRTKRHVVPKQRSDRFPAVADHIHATPTFAHALANPRHTVIGCS